ncbi:MAG: hypothetical protein OXH52_07780 [Gammaproteobacteria bacterium]|nr:hypothetical protein [Gammaproteobacteria bacterium]
MIAHLRDRSGALVRSGWTRREAEWLALVCLHSGVFLRSQYLAFIGRTNPALANRPPVPQARGRAAVARLAASHLPDRGPANLPGPSVRAPPASPAAPEVVLRRLLSLDYGLEHPDAAWLPTEDDKVNGLTAAGIAKDLLPRRLYQGAIGAQSGYFPHKLPLALDGLRATFLFVQSEDETESAVRTWGGQWAALARPAAPSRWSSSVGIRCVWRRPAGCSTSGRRRLPRP